MSEEDRTIVKERVSVIYHVAASVRFDDHLKKALLLNTRGTRELAQLALESKNLAVTCPHTHRTNLTTYHI